MGRLDGKVAFVTAAGGAIAITFDVSDDDAVKAAVERTIAEYGRIDMLFNAPDNIRANSILPGSIQTPRLLMASPDMDAVIERHRPHLPAGRLGQPREIARTALFLAGDEASFTSGADHYVDGGYAAI